MSSDWGEDAEIETLLGPVPLGACIPLNFNEWDTHFQNHDPCKMLLRENTKQFLGIGSSENAAYGGSWINGNSHKHHTANVSATGKQVYNPACHAYACGSPVSPSEGSSSSLQEEDGSPLGPLCDLGVNFSSEKIGREKTELPRGIIDVCGFSKAFEAMEIGAGTGNGLRCRRSVTAADANNVNCCNNLYRRQTSPVPAFTLPEQERATICKTQQEQTEGLSSWRDLNGLCSLPIQDYTYQRAETGYNPGLALYSSGPQSLAAAQALKFTFHPCQCEKHPLAADKCYYLTDSLTPMYWPFSSGCPNVMQMKNSLPSSPMSQFHHSESSPTIINQLDYDDNLILQERRLKHTASSHINDVLSCAEIGNWIRRKIDLNGAGLPTVFKYNAMPDMREYIYLMAKDQYGCRLLQKKFEEGTQADVQVIFNQIIGHVIELMINPFGNYLVQKLLDVCTEEQRMQILLSVTSEPGQVIRISLNTHGTRAVQKLIESLKSQQQVSMIISALKPGFLELIRDLNGNHVVQRCLQCFSCEDNKIIFCTAAKHCVEIGTHRHGCCVLQRCISYSRGEHRDNLVAHVSANGLLLAQDPYGNYVIQYILEMKIPSASEALMFQFEGNYVQLSQQKFSSNVVEKCLQVFEEEICSNIIRELISTSQFDKLLQDPFANYVIQVALAVSKGALHASLIEAIKPHAPALKTSPYCKRIISKAIFKR